AKGTLNNLETARIVLNGKADTMTKTGGAMTAVVEMRVVLVVGTPTENEAIIRLDSHHEGSETTATIRKDHDTDLAHLKVADKERSHHLELHIMALTEDPQ
ncbi:hypothetical protein GGF41_003205, partial [Coemansia sp. RSA 2531]